MKNIVGVILRWGNKYCLVIIENIGAPRMIIKFKIDPRCKNKRREAINKLAFFTKNGTITTIPD